MKSIILRDLRQLNYLNSHLSFHQQLHQSPSTSSAFLHRSKRRPPLLQTSVSSCCLTAFHHQHRAAQGFMPASPGRPGCALSVSSAPLLLLAGKKAQQQKQALYQGFPGDLQLLRNPSGQTTFFCQYSSSKH